MSRITDAGSVSTVDVLFMSFSVVYGALVGFKSSFFWLYPNFLGKCSFAKQETESIFAREGGIIVSLLQETD